jgi:hypothetical protein
LDETAPLIATLFEAMAKGGLIEPVFADTSNGEGYQIPASVMIWKAGDGSAGQSDPLRMQHADEHGFDGFGDPVNDFLYPALTDGRPKTDKR